MLTEVEEVAEFKYLGYVFQRNNGPDAHLRERLKKAVVAMKQTWGIGKRIFEDDFNRRVALFQHLVKSILLYGVEIWGWEEVEKAEALQTRYLRWTLELERCTPAYIVRMETQMKKMRIETGRRAVNYEIKVRKHANNKILQECMKELDSEKERTNWSQKRMCYLIRNGVLEEEFIRRAKEGDKKLSEQLAKRDEELQRQEEKERLEQTTYLPRYKTLVQDELPSYLKNRGHKRSQQIIARFRCGSEELWNRYWEKGDKLCRICGEAEETLDHLITECREELVAEDVEDMLAENGAGEQWMRQILKERNRHTPD